MKPWKRQRATGKFQRAERTSADALLVYATTRLDWLAECPQRSVCDKCHTVASATWVRCSVYPAFDADRLLGETEDEFALRLERNMAAQQASGEATPARVVYNCDSCALQAVRHALGASDDAGVVTARVFIEQRAAQQASKDAKHPVVILGRVSEPTASGRSKLFALTTHAPCDLAERINALVALARDGLLPIEDGRGFFDLRA